MTKSDDPMIGRLLDLDAGDPTLRDKYRVALHGNLDGHLSGSFRARYVLVGLGGLVGCIVCGSLAITEPASMRAEVRWLLVLFALFGLCWTVLAAVAIARRGGDFIALRTTAARMGFGFTLATVIALSAVSSLTARSDVGMPMVATGLAMLMLAAVVLIDARIERAESMIREQILRVEARLAGMADRRDADRDRG